MLLAFLFPVIHFSFSSLGLLEPVTRRAQESVIFLGLVLLGTLAVIEYVLLQRKSEQVELEKRMAEKEIEERTTYLHSLIENTPWGVVVLDVDNRVKACNPAFENLFLFSQLELFGSNLDDLLTTEEMKSEADEFTKRVLAGETVQLETRRRRRDGALIDVAICGVPSMMGGKLIGTFLLCLDISERVHAAEAKTRLEQQLLQAQKIEAIGQLAGGVAHDFNNLLMAINGYCELLKMKVPPEDLSHRYVMEIVRAAEHGASLTRQLLAFSRKQILMPRVMELNNLLANLGNMLQRLIGEDIELITVLDPELGRIKADPGQVEQVIVNLVVNARDAMPGGGRLTIRTANVDLDEDYAHDHHGSTPGRYVMLSISDNGCGMDDETVRKIFDPFFTTKEKGKGTGLGLSTVYGIIKQSGGYVWVESKLGIGTSFQIYFPRVEETEGTAELSASSQIAGISAGETILIVDDNESVRTSASAFLKSGGFQVLTANDGQEALDVAHQHNGPIHLLITDVVMPKVGGRELVKRLTPEYPKMKVLYISGYTGDTVLLQDIAEPDTAFLQKPASMQTLLQKVRELLIS